MLYSLYYSLHLHIFSTPFYTGKKRKKTRGDHFKLRFRKNFQALLEEEVKSYPDNWPNLSIHHSKYTSPFFNRFILSVFLCPHLLSRRRTWAVQKDRTTWRHAPSRPNCPSATSARCAVFRPTTRACPAVRATAVSVAWEPITRPGNCTVDYMFDNVAIDKGLNSEMRRLMKLKRSSSSPLLQMSQVDCVTASAFTASICSLHIWGVLWGQHITLKWTPSLTSGLFHKASL